MRILQTVFDLMDYGGIVNYVEIMHRAFRRLGHECEFVVLRNTTRDPYFIKSETPVQGAYDSTIGAKAHVTQGWYGVQVFSYGDHAQRKKWRRYARQFDLVIHQIPNPKWDADGNWKKLYDIDPPQIIATHDAHFRDLYPYMVTVADKIVGITAAQEAGYNALKMFPSRIAFMGCPIVPLNRRRQPQWADRQRRFVSAHVWKAWKRMDLVVRAIPNLPYGVRNVIAGDGIEGRYMRSIDKCKPRYQGIWRRAEKSGMDYRGFVSPRLLRGLYQSSRVMVDTSWSKVHAALGNHFNYSILEAINNGCIPLAVAESMAEQNDLTMFEAGETHLEFPVDVSPKELARLINHAINLPAKKARRINMNGREMLEKYHDADRVCQWFIDLMEDRPCGIYNDRATGRLTREIRDARDRYIEKMEQKHGG